VRCAEDSRRQQRQMQGISQTSADIASSGCKPCLDTSLHAAAPPNSTSTRFIFSSVSRLL
jgi:hypothetical protein